MFNLSLKNLIFIIWVFTVFLFISPMNSFRERDLMIPQNSEEDYPEDFTSSKDDSIITEPDTESVPISDSDVAIN